MGSYSLPGHVSSREDVHPSNPHSHRGVIINLTDSDTTSSPVTTQRQMMASIREERKEINLKVRRAIVIDTSSSRTAILPQAMAPGTRRSPANPARVREMGALAVYITSLRLAWMISSCTNDNGQM